MTRDLVCWSHPLDCRPLPFQYCDITLQRGTEFVPLDLDVVTGLQVHPECLGGSEGAGEAQDRARGDAALAVDNLVDPARRNTDVLRQAVLRELERHQRKVVADEAALQYCRKESTRGELEQSDDCVDHQDGLSIYLHCAPQLPGFILYF